MSDRGLIEAVLAGDGRAADEFVRRYQRFVLHVLHDAGLRHGRIEDVCQDVFVALFGDGMARLRAWRGSDGLHRYIAAIARHKAADVFRGRGWAPVPLDDPEVGEQADPGRGPRGALLAGERREAVAEALRQLSDEDRELFRLTYIEGCSPAAIAGLLGIARNAVDQRLFQLKRRVAQHLGRLFPGLFGDDPRRRG